MKLHCTTDVHSEKVALLFTLLLNSSNEMEMMVGKLSNILRVITSDSLQTPCGIKKKLLIKLLTTLSPYN